jgi:hypothetical protein
MNISFDSNSSFEAAEGHATNDILPHLQRAANQINASLRFSA